MIQVALLVSGLLTAHMLSVRDRGNLALLLLAPAVVSQVLSWGLPASVTIFATGNPGAWRSLMGSLAPVIFVQLVLTSVLTLVANQLLLGGRGLFLEGVVLTVIAPCLLVQYYALAVLQGEMRWRWFNTARSAAPACFAFGLLGLAVTRGSLEAVVAVYAITQLVVTSVTCRVALSESASDPPESVSRAAVTQVCSQGVRGFLAQVSPMESFKLDQMSVGLMLPAEASGLYAVGLSLSNAPRFVADGLAAVAYPTAAVAAPHDRVRVVRHYAGLTVLLCLVVAVPLMIASPWLIPALFGEQYAPAGHLALILTGASLVLSVRRVLLDCLRAFGSPTKATLLEIGFLAMFGLGLVFWRGTAQAVAIDLLVATVLALVAVAAVVGSHLRCVRTAS